MNEQIKKLNEQLKRLWQESSRKNKIIFFSAVGIVFIAIIAITIITTSKTFVPLYTNLAPEEVGQIKEELDAENVPYEITDGGTSIKVPKEESERLLVELAGKQIPKSGHIDYSFFSENASWGITDNEFNMMKLDAMNTELANLIKSIDGVEDAEVMITLPEQSVFVSDQGEEASAAIVLHTEFGYEFKGNQIESLYHLVSKAVPNLPPENIVIRNQYLEYFDLQESEFEDDYTYQQTVKRDTERDIQRRLQQMLGAMVGMDRVLVSVTADIDFTKENRHEELVEPVDIDNMEGIPVSIETIRETFEGTDEGPGVVGTGEEDIPNYPAVLQGQDGDYELVKDTINYELNRINREIVEAPYKVRDLGVQVVIDNVIGVDDGELQLLSQQEQGAVEEGVASILNSIITTSIDGDYDEDEIEVDDKISIVFQQFSHHTDSPDEFDGRSIPLWVYILGGILLAVIILLIFLLVRRRREEEVEEELPLDSLIEDEEVPDLMAQPKSETDIQREQLERMADENPEDFAKLLRSWISHD
ncbi:MAG TPA: flagellar basal-body MS-ring/collar protein FliF [Pseudogracilibacillus sp.]|nr:flagellar basal-body MS-ring/collar protein FliF [Pseudogracilibacillus sp.]